MLCSILFSLQLCAVFDSVLWSIQWFDSMHWSIPCTVWFLATGLCSSWCRSYIDSASSFIQAKCMLSTSYGNPSRLLVEILPEAPLGNKQFPVRNARKNMQTCLITIVFFWLRKGLLYTFYISFPGILFALLFSFMLYFIVPWHKTIINDEIRYDNSKKIARRWA